MLAAGTGGDPRPRQGMGGMGMPLARTPHHKQRPEPGHAAAGAKAGAAVLLGPSHAGKEAYS